MGYLSTAEGWVFGWIIASAAAQQPVECPFGVNTHQASDSALDQVAAAGLGWVRFDFNWQQFEPAEDVYDWTVPDRFVDAAVLDGLNIYVSIGYTPQWAAGRACDDLSAYEDDHCKNRIPADVADWEDFVRESVLRYGDRVKHWGIWNEPNLSGFFEGTRDEWIQQILIPAADVVHTECTDCFVVGPELAHLRGAHWDSDEGMCVLGACSFNGWDYSLEHILIDAGSYFDIISHHKYTDPAQTFWEELIAGEFLLGVQYMHGVKELTDTHAPGKPVWITEFGWESAPGGPHDPLYVADQLTEAYTAFPGVQAGTLGQPAWPELEKLFWYDVTDDPVIHPWGQFTWGLLDANEIPKPAYDAYAQVVIDLGGCTAFVGGPPTVPTGSTGVTGDTGDDGTPPGDDDDDDDDVTSPVDTAPPSTGDPVPPDPDASGEGKTSGCGCGGGAGDPVPASLVAVGLTLLRRRRAI